VEVLVKNLNDGRLAVEAVISRHHGKQCRWSYFSSIALTVREQCAAQFTGAASSLRNQLRNASVNGLREAWLSLLGIVPFLMTYGPGLLLWMAILFFPARFLFRKWRQANWTAVTQKAVGGTRSE
jgi:hypothetical protein